MGCKKVIKPIVKATKKVLSKVNATYSSGTAISGSPGIFSFGVQGGVSIDTKGNVAIQATVSAGLTIGSGNSITSYKTITNAPNVKNLEGFGYQAGGSLPLPASSGALIAGGDLNVIPSVDEKTSQEKLYYGLTTVVGLGTPDVHVEFSQTITIPHTDFNIFDVAENVYRSIMEW